MPQPDPRRPYNDLPLVPPQVDLESRAILKALVGARAAVAELKAAGQLLPDQSVLVSALPLLEAKDSTAIENIVTTNDALFREASLAEAASDPAAKEALRYRAALYQGLASLGERPITTRTAVEICRTLKGIDLDIRAVPGTTLANTATGEVIYTPPQGQDHLRGLLANWEAFVNAEDELDPLVRMAVAHYQFEAIHPFIDGNGRTGRILNVLILVQAGLLDRPTLYLSRYILRRRAEYYRLLAAVTFDGAWEPWLVYMLTGVAEMAAWTNARIRAIRRLMTHTDAHIRRNLPRLHSHELVEIVFAQPYCRIATLVEAGIAKRQTASTTLKALADVGVLEEEKVGRDKLFIHRKYMALLSDEGHEFQPYPGTPLDDIGARR